MKRHSETFARFVARSLVLVGIFPRAWDVAYLAVCSYFAAAAEYRLMYLTRTRIRQRSMRGVRTRPPREISRYACNYIRDVGRGAYFTEERA